MLSLEQALEQLLKSVEPIGTEILELREAHRSYLAREIRAAHPLPLFDNSAMDGWAVRSADASKANARLTQIGITAAGDVFSGEIRAGQCVRVFTGSPLPAGADAVVMQEDTRADGDHVLIVEPVKPWENVRFRGEDVKEGAVVAEAGAKLTPQLIGLLGACGVARVETYQPLSVSILATGNELIQPGEELRPGGIYESNRLMISALATEAGLYPKAEKIVPDDLGKTILALKNATAQSDAIVTCGGVSVGEFDYVKEAIETLGGEIDFWRVAIKPGKPFVFGRVLGKPVFGLPGNPVSALVTFLLLARPALLRMSGAEDVTPGVSLGELGEAISNPGDRRHFVRVAMNGSGIVRATGAQASHRLGSLAAANGLLDVPAGANWETGRRVSVLRFS